MQLLNVVIAQKNRDCAEHLAIALRQHFRGVSIVHDSGTLRLDTLRSRAGVAVLDLELISVEELANYCNEFPHVAVICTHRVPDEAMWTKILAAGAMDCCSTLDIRVIVEAANRKAKLTNAKAA